VKREEFATISRFGFGLVSDLQLQRKKKGLFMAKREGKKGNERSDPRPSDDNADLPPMPPRDPIEPDPMNPVQAPPADTEPKPMKRPDLDWSEHED
jgi:hypothetical protein